MMKSRVLPRFDNPLLGGACPSMCASPFNLLFFVKANFIFIHARHPAGIDNGSTGCIEAAATMTRASCSSCRVVDWPIRIASALMSGVVDGDSEGQKGPIALTGSGNPSRLSVVITTLIFQLWMTDPS